MPSREPTENCRIFVSRKQSDRDVFGKEIQEDLETIGAGRLEFFDDTDIEFGDKWRQKIREELDKANVLWLVLTKPAKKEFDWPLYEAGLFEDLEDGSQERVVCLFPDEGKCPSQLNERQAVKANPDSLFKLLKDLFTKKHFSGTVQPLNPKAKDKDLQAIAKKISDLVNGIADPNEIRSVSHGNKWIELVCPKSLDSLSPDVEVESDERSLGDLFDLQPKPVRGETWKWSQIEEAAKLEGDPKGYNLLWIEELRNEIAAKMNPDPKHRHRSKQLTGRYLGKDGKLYRPEIELCREYADGRLKLELTFSEQVHGSWLRPTPLVALAAMINLASRIRHDLIEPHLKKLPRWQLRDDNQARFEQLNSLKESIERDGFFINMLTQEAFLEAFDGHPDENLRVAKLQQEFGKTIEPQLRKAVSDLDVELTQKALRAWKENNREFLDIGINVYRRGLGLEEAA
ncbi:MAG: TIR domain-containing protein [bacterium]|nr:TIR domain-containing protein [bacterium]